MLGQKIAYAFLSRGSIVIWGWCFYTALICGGFTILCFNLHEEQNATHKNNGEINIWLLAANSTLQVISSYILLVYTATKCDVLITVLRRSRPIRNNVPFEYFRRIGGCLLYTFGILRLIILLLSSYTSFVRLSGSLCPNISMMMCVNLHIALVWFMTVILISRHCCRYEVYHWNKKLMLFVFIGTVLLSNLYFKIILTIVAAIWFADRVFQALNRTHTIVSAAVLMDDYIFLKIRRANPIRDHDAAGGDGNPPRSCSVTLSVRNLSQYTLNSHHTEDDDDSESDNGHHFQEGHDLKPPMALVVADASDCMSINATTASSDIDIFLHRKFAASSRTGWSEWIGSLLSNWNLRTLEQHEGTFVNIFVPCISHVNGHPFFVREVDENYIYVAINVIKGGWTWQLWGMLALVCQEVPYVRIQMNSSYRSECCPPTGNGVAPSRRRDSMTMFQNTKSTLSPIARQIDQQLGGPSSCPTELCQVGNHKAALAPNRKFQRLVTTTNGQLIEQSPRTGSSERRLASAQIYNPRDNLYAFAQAPELLVSFEIMPHEITTSRDPPGDDRNSSLDRFARSKTTGGINSPYRAVCKTALTNMGSLESSMQRSNGRSSNTDQQRVSISPIAQVVEIASSKSSGGMLLDLAGQNFLDRGQQTDRSYDRFVRSSRDYGSPINGRVVGQSKSRMLSSPLEPGNLSTSGIYGSYSPPMDDQNPRSVSETCSCAATQQIYAKCVTDADITEGLRRRKSTHDSIFSACKSHGLISFSGAKKRIKTTRLSSSTKGTRSGTTATPTVPPLSDSRGSPSSISPRRADNLEGRGGDHQFMDGKMFNDGNFEKVSLVNIHRATPTSVLRSTLEWDQKLILSLPVYSKMPTHDGSRHVVIMCTDYGIYKALARIQTMFRCWATDNRQQLVRDTADVFKQQLQRSSTTNQHTRETIPFRKSEKYDSLFATFYKFGNGLYNVVLLTLTPMCLLVDLTFITAWLIAILMTCQFLSVIADAGRIAEQMMESRPTVCSLILKGVDCLILLITVALVAFNYSELKIDHTADDYALSGRLGTLRLAYDCSGAYFCTKRWDGSSSALVILVGLCITDMYRAGRNFSCAYWLRSDGIVRSGVVTQCCVASTLDCIWAITENNVHLLTFVHDSLVTLAQTVGSPTISKGISASCCGGGTLSDSSHHDSNQDSSQLYKSFVGRDFTFKVVIPPYLKNSWAWLQYPIFDVVTSNSHAVLKSCIQKRNASLNRGAKIRVEISEDHKTGRDVACCWQDLKDYVQIISKNNGEIHVAPT